MYVHCTFMYMYMIPLTDYALSMYMKIYVLQICVISYFIMIRTIIFNTMNKDKGNIVKLSLEKVLYSHHMQVQHVDDGAPLLGGAMVL